MKTFSSYSNLQKFLFFNLIVLFFAFPVSAFSDDFNDCDISDWTLSVGSSFTTETITHGGISSCVLKGSLSTGLATWTASKSVSGVVNFWSFDIRGAANAAYASSNSYARIYFDSNGSSSNYFTIQSTVQDNGIYQINSNIAGFVPYTIGTLSSYWSSITVTKSGSNIVINIYNNTNNNNTLVNTQTIAYTNIVSPNIFTIGIYALNVNFNANIYIDNIIVSASTPNNPSSISWGSTSYTVGDSGSYTWSIKDSDWTDTYLFIPYQFRISIFKNDIEDKNIALGSQTGTQYYTFDEIGNYNIQLMKYYNAYYSLGLAGTMVGNSSTSVRPIGDNYIYTQKVVPAGIPFNITYVYASTPPIQGELNSFILEKFMDTDYVSYKTQSINNNNVVGGSTYTTTLSVSAPGQYRVWLFDLSKGKLVSSTFSAIGGSISPTINLTSSYIKMDQTIYQYGDKPTLDYGIDSINYSNSTLSKYISIYNYGSGKTSSFTFETIKQEDEISFYLNFATHEAGLNALRLNSLSNGNISILAYVNFSIATVDAEGYGLTVSKTDVCPQDIVNINVSSPGNATFSILWFMTSGITQQLDSFSITGNKMISYKFGNNLGIYSIRISDSAKNLKMYRTVTVQACVPAPGSTAVIPASPTEIANTFSQNQIDNLLIYTGMGNSAVSKFFLALLITISVTLIGYRMSNKSEFGGVITGFASYAFFTYIDYFPKWIIILIILILASKYFR